MFNQIIPHKNTVSHTNGDYPRSTLLNQYRAAAFLLSWIMWWCNRVYIVSGCSGAMRPGPVDFATVCGAPWTAQRSGLSDQGWRSGGGCCLWTTRAHRRTSLSGSSPLQARPEWKEGGWNRRMQNCFEYRRGQLKIGLIQQSFVTFHQLSSEKHNIPNQISQSL